MSSNNYKSYNHPYHQQSSSYQTAPASNTNAQSSRQYQQAPSTSTNQSADYLSYSGPSYGTSSSGYGNTQDSTWSGSSTNYSTTRDNGSRAAEVLRNMSNTGYSASATAPSQSGFTATNATNVHCRTLILRTVRRKLAHVVSTQTKRKHWRIGVSHRQQHLQAILRSDHNNSTTRNRLNSAQLAPHRLSTASTMRQLRTRTPPWPP
jgi:hypothetical protein